MPNTVYGVSVERLSRATVIRVCGALKLGEPTLDELRRRFCELASREPLRVVIDLQGVPAIDSTGIGVLMQAYTSSANRRGHCKLINLRHMPEEILRVVGVLELFEVYPDLNSALASFDPAA